MDQLPEQVLVHIIRRLQRCDAVSLSQTCVRLRGLVLHVAAVHSSPDGPQQASTLHSVLAAADQRLHAVTTGTWREALLMAAWQRQQASAPDTAAPRRALLAGAPGRPHAPAGLSTQLQSVLNMPDAAAAFIDGTATSNSSSSNRNGTHAAAGTGQRGPGQSTDFGLYWQPGQEMLRQTSCLVTDGRSTVLLAPSSGAVVHSQVSTQAGLTTASAATTTETQPPASITISEPSRGESSLHAAASPAGRTAQPNSSQSGFQLLHGHLPPAERTTSLPLHQLLLNPAGQTSAHSSGSSGSSLALDYERLASLPGLRHMLHYLRFWWGLPPGPTAGTSQAAAGAGAGADAAAAANSGVSGDCKGEQQVALYTGARQVLLLPLPPPPGSIPGLLAPWPPQLSPGSGYQRLGSASCDATSGARGCPRLLRDALLYNETALLCCAGPAGCIKLPNLNAVGVLGPPSRWWGELRHLDLSGQVSVGDDVLATTLVQCSSLKTLSLADTSAGCITFMTWPQRRPDGTHPATSAPAATTAAANAAPTAVEALRARMSAGLRLSQGLQQPHTPQAAAPAAGSQPGGSSSSFDGRAGQLVHGAGAPAAGSAAAAIVSCAPQPAVCTLRVLDVSGCAELAALTARVVPAARLLQAALGAMPHLEVLLACRLNADAVFTCSTCHNNSLPMALQLTGQQPSAHGSSGASSRAGRRHASAQHGTGRQGSTHHAAHLSTSTQAGLTAQPYQQQVSCSFCHTLSGLAELDVSAAADLSVVTLFSLLQTCSSLRRLGVAGCKSLGEGDGARQLEVALTEIAAHQQQESGQTASSSDKGTSCSSAACLQPSVGQCPAAAAAAAASSPPLSVQPVVGQGLLRLAVGWGWSAGAISSVLRGAPNLVSFTAGVGACVTDDVLAQLASSCCHLQSLSLALCTVTSSGVRAVLQGCPHLTSLQLQQCVGPFSGAEMTAHHQQAPSQTHQQSPASAYLPKRWQLSTLQLSGSSTSCTDSQMLQLLGLAPGGHNMQPGRLVHDAARSSDDSSSNSSNSSSSSSSSRGSGQHTAALGPSSRQPSAKVVARLTDLCLVRVYGLTDGFLLQVAAAGCHLQHISLQHCSRPVAFVATARAETPRMDGGAVCAGGRVLSFSADAVLRLVDGSCALSLRSVTLRHAALLPRDFIASLVKKAPLVQRVVLDACDLKGGFDFEPDFHGALNVVHVARCQLIDDAFNASSEVNVPVIDAEGVTQQRVRDKDLVVHMLSLCKTIHLLPC